VALEKARLDNTRYTQLFASGAASVAERDNAAIQLKSAMAQRDAIKEQLDELKNGSRTEELEQAQARAIEAQSAEKLVKAGSRVEDIKAARGAVEAAQGKLQSIQVAIDELVIRAPMPARVEALDLRPGDILQPSATAATLVESDQLYVRIYIPETQLGHIKVGMEVPVTVDSFSDRTFRGHVEKINSIGEFSPRNLQTADERADQVFAARIGLAEGREMLKAGMAAFIRVPK
jgi:multidrug resistance efflux pump